MRTVYEQRRANLRELARQWGGPTSLARIAVATGALALLIAIADLLV